MRVRCSIIDYIAEVGLIIGNMGMGGGFDPNAMAMMYQNMFKSESIPDQRLMKMAR